jgi:hypothetical protein
MPSIAGLAVISAGGRTSKQTSAADLLPELRGAAAGGGDEKRSEDRDQKTSNNKDGEY